MDKRLIDTIEKIKTLSSQNAEFDAAMRELFGKTDSASSVFSESSDGRFDEIYEYYKTGKDVYLGCFCAPNPCHADVIARKLQQKLIKEKLKEKNKGEAK